MPKNPEAVGTPEKLSNEEVEKLIDRFPEDHKILRDDCLFRLREALRPYREPRKGWRQAYYEIRRKIARLREGTPQQPKDSWQEADRLFHALFVHIFMERFLPKEADYLSLLKHVSDYRTRIAFELIGERLGYTAEQTEKLSRCLDMGQTLEEMTR